MVNRNNNDNEPVIVCVFEVSVDVVQDVPVLHTRVFGEASKQIDGIGDVGVHSNGSIHECTESLW